MNNKKLSLTVFLTILLATYSIAAQNPVPANWKTYSGAAFSFRYPPNFALKIKNRQVQLLHKVRFHHTDPCDASDRPGDLDFLEDFNVTFNIEKPNGDSKTGEVTKEDWETTSEGLIDTGNLKGEVMLNTVEGCGQYVYSFPAKNGKMLKIVRLQISLFNPTAFQYGEDKKALKLKTVVKPAEEIRIFKLVVESIKLK